MHLKDDKKRIKNKLGISALLYWTKCILKMTKKRVKNKVDISRL